MNFEYVAGFEPKDLMMIQYLPALCTLLLASLVIVIIKRKGHPYLLAGFVLLPISVIWYLYDMLFSKHVDRSQALILAGVASVLGIAGIASTSIVPADDTILNIMALAATVLAAIFIIIAIAQHRK